jgi:hypothetical protein
VNLTGRNVVVRLPVVQIRFAERQLIVADRLLREQRRIEAERFRHVFDLRQIVEIVQAEANQKFLRRRVEERPADDLLAADDLDQVRSSRVLSTPEVLTPRTSVISAAVIGWR